MKYCKIFLVALLASQTEAINIEQAQTLDQSQKQKTEQKLKVREQIDQAID